MSGEDIIKKLEKALSHAINCNGVDVKCNMADSELAKKLMPYIIDYMNDTTSVQIYERMSEEDRKLIGDESKLAYLKEKYGF